MKPDLVTPGTNFISAKHNYNEDIPHGCRDSSFERDYVYIHICLELRWQHQMLQEPLH